MRRTGQLRGTLGPGLIFRQLEIGLGTTRPARAPVSRVGLVPDADPRDVLDRMRGHALGAADELYAVDPLLGDPRVQVLIDSFVDQAVHGLRTLADLAAAPDPAWMQPPWSTRGDGIPAVPGAQAHRETQPW